MADGKKSVKLIRGVYVNREYSWLKFNLRVLAQAADESTPVLERCRFLSIFCSNLDEFFMVRIGSLYNEAEIHPNERDNKTKLKCKQQIDAIADRITRLYDMREHVFTHLKHALSDSGINILTYLKLSRGRKDELKKYFKTKLLPLLSPMVLDAKHPLVRFENLKCYMLYKLKKNDHAMIGVMEIPDRADSLYRFSGGKKYSFITMEEIIKNLGQTAFPGYTATSSMMIRVTRNADFEMYVEDADIEYNNDFSRYLKSKVEKRPAQNAVRLEVCGEKSKSLMKFVTEALGIKQELIFDVRTNFGFKYLTTLSSRIDKELADALSYPPFKPNMADREDDAPSIIDEVRKKDVLLKYPYDSMDPLIRLLNECADRKDCISIKITIYRLADHSRIAAALMRASENGIDVTVVIELCARFDEENNLYFASRLQEAGCNIIYGMENYKVHSKIISIVFSDDSGVNYITHLGTGNYNESTAKQYTDLNIITADRQIGEDGAAFFRNVAISNADGEYAKLLIAPKYFKQKILELLDGEIAKALQGGRGVFIGKMNSLTDKVIIDKLVEASCAGVEIKLIVRGICCLLPCKRGKTENISVISIVGRFLEHSRIYCFGEGEDRVMYISSADLMTRNTDRRVEIATPVLDKDIADEIYEMLQIMLADNVNARKLLSDGTYVRVTGGDKKQIDSQKYYLQSE